MSLSVRTVVDIARQWLTSVLGLTTAQLMPAPETAPINLGLAVEQPDIELEELVEDVDNEFKTDAADVTEHEPEDDEGLRGEWMPFKRKFTGRHSHPPALTDKQIKQKLNGCKNLHEIPVASRGEIYRFWESEMNKSVAHELKTRLKEYEQSVNGWALTRVSIQ
jgi:helicase required for RNAi-mediated heterochromatin assembly 1